MLGVRRKPPLAPPERLFGVWDGRLEHCFRLGF